MSDGASPKFIVDYMLGRLARWLLMLGYDTVYVSDGKTPDMDQVAQASREGRVFVTRDTRIPAVAGVKKIVLKDQKLENQLKQLCKELDLRPDPALFFSRCTLCNQPTQPVEKASVLASLPEKVRSLQTSFFRCPKCSKLYWTGTHVYNTKKKIEEILK
jgi:uncharacterized protein with PIN domain